MKIKINNSKSTLAVKEVFNKTFPFLKIEFLKTPHITGEATPAKNIFFGNVLLGELNPNIQEGFLSIQPEDSVASVEQLFQEEFGLPIQVFRKQKDVWIETTRTDQLTLAQQNEKGRQVSAPPLHPEPGDRWLEDGQY